MASGYTPSFADLDDLSLDPLSGPLESAVVESASRVEEDLPWLVEADDSAALAEEVEAASESEAGVAYGIVEPDVGEVDSGTFDPLAADHETTLDAVGSPAEHSWVEEEALGPYVEPWDEAEFQVQESAVLGETEPPLGEAETVPAAEGAATNVFGDLVAIGDELGSVAPTGADPATVQAREMAARLERIAQALRDHGPAGVLSQPGGDPLAALITGYLLGSSQRRDP